MKHAGIPPRQRAALLAADGPARFKHFIGQAADVEMLWGLRGAGGWVALADDTGAPGFPVWPHPDYAAACAVEAWASCVPGEIGVHEFAGRLTAMAASGVAVAVFPTPSMKGVWVAADELARCLRDALVQYE